MGLEDRDTSKDYRGAITTHLERQATYDISYALFVALAEYAARRYYADA